MARPRKDAALDQFTSTEMGLAAGVTARNFMLLAERGLGPPAKVPAAGKTSTRYWDVSGLSEAAILGALHKGGAGLFAAARLARVFAEEEAEPRGRFQSRLEDQYLEARIDRPDDEAGDFWVHHYLRARSDTYTPRQARKDDILLELIDRAYVCTVAPIRLGNGRFESPLCRIINWSRDDVSILRWWEEITVPGDDTSAWEAARKAIDSEYAKARDNAIGVLRVNVSLAIRTALDNVHDHRTPEGTGQ